jgi:hypothetical protein
MTPRPGGNDPAMAGSRKAARRQAKRFAQAVMPLVSNA